MSLPDPDRRDRAAGALLGTAVGDALGVPYEFATAPGPGELARMTGGGLGGFAPGEWSDDTAMAVAVARVAVTSDLRDPSALDAVADGFLEWYAGHPPDIGNQTRAVLEATRQRLTVGVAGSGRVMREESQSYALDHAHAAGNGALMRTAPVALAYAEDRIACAEAARAVAGLTHADPLAGDSAVIWSEAVRVALSDGGLAVDAGLDLLPDSRRDRWAAWLAEASHASGGPVPGARFRPNGFTVTALQAAVAAITGTPVPADDPGRHLQQALHSAVRIGDDTDTVAAIAGGLLGARWGASAVPPAWRQAVHGWPGLTGDDLVALVG